MAARAEAVGKQVAFSASAMPRWSASPSCRRTPWGPSLITKEGTFAEGIARESQALAPDRRAAASRRVRSLASVSTECSIVVNCLSCSIAGAVNGSSVVHDRAPSTTACMICRLGSVFCMCEAFLQLG